MEDRCAWAISQRGDGKSIVWEGSDVQERNVLNTGDRVGGGAFDKTHWFAVEAKVWAMSRPDISTPVLPWAQLLDLGYVLRRLIGLLGSTRAQAHA
jgi:hypothetical protein